jgi:Na+-transporting NADH:ubiquinone oxidoreductase subunit D
MNNNVSFKDMLIKGAVIFNPVLIQLVGLCPVVAASTTFSTSVVLSAALCLDLILTCVIASALFKKIPRWVRVALYLIIGLALVCPILWYIETFTLINLGLGLKIYLPLLAINSATAVHCEQFAVKNDVKPAFYDACAVGIGGSVVCILVGTVREIFGLGSLAGVKLDLPVTFRGMALPFGCLVLLGFLAAGLKAFIAYKYPNYLEESEPDTAPEYEDATEVEIFDEFWVAETSEPAPEFEIEQTVHPVYEEVPAPVQPQTAEEIRESADLDIDAFFKSLGLDINEKGDEQ